MITGGWNIISGDMSIAKNPDANAALEQASNHMAGAGYEPLALLGTQVVAGTNYCILCRTTATTPDAMPRIRLVYVYQDPQGKTEITGSKEIIGEMSDGGFAANDGDTALEKNADVKASYEKAFAHFTGASHEPIAYLGSQIVAGTNYLLLCKRTAAIPNAAPALTLVTIYADLQGNAEINKTEEMTLGGTKSQTSEQESAEIVPGAAMIPNPWTKYKTPAEAGTAAGVPFSVPENLGEKSISLIQAMKGIAEVRYGTDEDEIIYRKGSGSDDISGDYGIYKSSDLTIGGQTVTLRENDGKVYGAVWNANGFSYSYFVRNGIAQKTAKTQIADLMKDNK